MPFDVALKLEYFHAREMSSVFVGGSDFWQDAKDMNRTVRRRQILDMVGV